MEKTESYSSTTNRPTWLEDEVVPQQRRSRELPPRRRVMMSKSMSKKEAALLRRSWNAGPTGSSAHSSQAC